MSQLVRQSGQLDTWAVIEAWANQASKSSSKRTREDYKRHLLRFAQTVSLEDATPAHIEAFVRGKGPSGREPSASTVIVRLAAVSSFYNFVSRMTGMINPCKGITRPRPQESRPHGLTVDELKALLGVIPNTPGGLRDKAIILTAVYTGLRRSELLGIRAGDLSRNGCVFYTVKVKGGRVRTRELPQPAFEAICGALQAQQRPLETLAPEDRIFDISHQTYYAYLRKHGKRAGLEIAPHALRHTAAKLRLQAGVTVDEIGDLLGHRNLAITAIYLKQLEGDHDNSWQRVADILAAG